MPRKTRREQGGVKATRKSERPAEVYAIPSTAVKTAIVSNLPSIWKMSVMVDI